MKKQHLFQYRLFSAVFDTQQSKDDVINVIVTSLWIWLLLLSRDFISEDCCAKFDGNWSTYKGEAEGGTVLTQLPQPI